MSQACLQLLLSLRVYVHWPDSCALFFTPGTLRLFWWLCCFPLKLEEEAGASLVCPPGEVGEVWREGAGAVAQKLSTHTLLWASRPLVLQVHVEMRKALTRITVPMTTTDRHQPRLVREGPRGSARGAFPNLLQSSLTSLDI